MADAKFNGAVEFTDSYKALKKKKGDKANVSPATFKLLVTELKVAKSVSK